jgi:hypothetical protein
MLATVLLFAGAPKGPHALDVLHVIGEPVEVLEASRALAACDVPEGGVHVMFEVLSGTVAWAAPLWRSRSSEEDRCPASALVGLAARGGRGRSYVIAAVVRRTPTLRSSAIPTVRIGQPVLSGSVDATIVRRYLRSHADDVQACARWDPLGGPPFEGRLALEVVFSPNGTVVSATTGSTTAVGRCIEEVARRWTLPKPKGGGILKVRYPIRFLPERPAPARFRQLPLPASIRSELTALAESEDGLIVLGTRGLGVHLFDGEHTARAPWTIDAAARVRRIVALSNRELAVLTDRGAYAVGGGSTRLLTPAPSWSAARLDRVLAIGTDHGLLEIADGGRPTYHPSIDRAWAVPEVETSGGTRWIIADGKCFEIPDRTKPLGPGRPATGFVRDRELGLYVVDRGLGRPGRPCEIACGRPIDDAVLSAQGLLLREGDALSVADIASGEVRPIEDEDGLYGAPIDLLETSSGGVLVATSAGLFQLMPPRVFAADGLGLGAFHVTRTTDGILRATELPDLFFREGSSGDLYLADGGRFWRVGDRSPIFEGEDAIVDAVVGRDRIFVATAGALHVIDGAGARVAFVATGSIAALAPHGDGAVAATSRGVVAYDGEVRNLAVEPSSDIATSGGVIAAATERGLLVVTSTRTTLLQSSDGLAGDRVEHVAIDRGEIVTTGPAGLSLVVGGDVRTITGVDGLPRAEIRDVFSDLDGTIWIATSEGVYGIERSLPPPIVALARVLVDRREVDRRDTIVIPWTASLLTLEATASSWVDRRDNVVLEVVAGRESGEIRRTSWRSSSLDLLIHDLGDGPAELVISARGIDGARSRPVRLSIDIGAPPWRRPLLVAGVVLGLLMGAIGVTWGPKVFERHIAWRLELRGARRALSADPSKAIDVAVDLFRSVSNPTKLIRILADEASDPSTAAWLRVIDLLDRDPDAGLRLARTRKQAASEGWGSFVSRLSEAAATSDLASLAKVTIPADTAAGRGLGEAVAVLGEYEAEESVAKRWDLARGTYDYLGTLAERCGTELPYPIDRAFTATTTEVRRRLAREMKAHDWKGADAERSADAVDSRKLRFVVENEYPRPIARAFARLGQSDDPAAKVPLLGALLETLLAYSAIVLIAEAFGRGRAPSLEAELAQRLLRGAPTAGDWLALARAAGSGDSALAELFSKKSLPALEEAVAMRNKLVHRNVGITRSDVTELGTRLGTILWSIARIRDQKLMVLLGVDDGGVKRHRGKLIHGFHDVLEDASVDSNVLLPRGAPLLVDPKARVVIDLRPLAAWERCEACGTAHFFWFSRVVNKAVEYISAEGHVRRDRAAAERVAAFVAHDGIERRATPEILTADDAFAEDARRRLAAGYVLPHEDGLEIEAPIGRGGFADVYRARRRSDGTRLAVKVLPYQFLRDPAVLRRFRQEAASARRLDHPNVVRVLGIGEDVGDHFLVMELATGWTTSAGVALDLRGLDAPLAPEVVLAIARQILDALSYVHGHGIVHRDIKPANILLFEHAVVKLGDFGTARGHDALDLTRTGLIAATPEYMSPEQASSQPVDLRTDLYSTGIVLYELLSGTLPFTGDTPLALALARLEADPIPITRSAKGAPKPLAELIDRLLAREPRDRPASASEALAMLS